MTTESKPEPEFHNPRYAGATPEMVARALLRRESETRELDEVKDDLPAVNGSEVRSSI